MSWSRSAWAGVVVGVFTLSSFAGAESLGAAAKREKARQKALREKNGEAKVVDEYDLLNNRGKLANDPGQAPAVAPRSPDRRLGGSSRDAQSASRQGQEQEWRSRSSSARSDVTRLEAEVARLDALANRDALGSPCGRPTGSNRYYVQDGPAPGSSCEQDFQKRKQATLSRLQAARSELSAARSRLDALPDEARKAGAQPGWIR